MFNAENKSRDWQIWGFYFELLKAFEKREKHCNVPIEHEEKGVQLGKWVARQRAYGPTLREAQRSSLEALRGWRWGEQESFSEHFSDDTLPLFSKTPFEGKKQQEKKPGTLRKRRFVISVDDSNCIVQRNADNTGESIVIKADEVEQPSSGRWQSRYRLLLKFLNREGHCRVPVNHEESGVKLGVWVANQKQIYRTKKMKPTRREKLESLPGWVWTRQKKKQATDTRQANNGTSNAQKWESHYELLQRFGQREGHYLVPSRHVEEGFRLGVWVARHRSKRWSIAQEHREKLEMLPGWTWDGQEGKWMKRFHLLEQFVAREGHARVVKGHLEKGMKLGVWVMHQHDSYRRGELSETRAARLEQIPEWEWNGEQENLTSLDVDNIAQEVWSSLFGLGFLSEENACLHAVRRLYQAGIVTARSARTGSPIHVLLINSFNRGVELGILERTSEGMVRAILADAHCYEDEDWDMCIRAIQASDDMQPNAVVVNALSWAEEVLGLDLDTPENTDFIEQCLRDALARRSIDG